MKQIVLFLIILLLIAPTASAVEWNPIEIGKNMIADGMINALHKLADEIMDFVCGTPKEVESVEEGHDSIATMIINFASWSVTPFTYPSIIKMMGISFAVGIGVLVTYFFIGSGAAAMKDTMGNYVKNAMYGILLMSFAPLLIWIVMLFASVLKTMMMESIADSISPSIESCTVLYLMMAIMWLFVAIFFGISNVVICVTAGLSFALGALYASEKTRHITTWAADYFTTMVMMQVLVITIAVVVVGFVTDIKSGAGVMLTPGMESAIYVGMILLMLIMCAFMTFGKALVLKTAKTAIRLVI